MTESSAPPLAMHPFLLRAIYLRESETKLAQEFDPLRPGQKLLGQFNSSSGNCVVGYSSPTPQGKETISTCTFTTKFDFVVRLVDEDQPTEQIESQRVVGTIMACLSVDYQIAPGAEEPTQEFLERYGQSTAVLHTWPYWREFCHSSMARMHLPLMMVPLLTPNLPGAVKEEKPTVPKARKTQARKKN